MRPYNNITKWSSIQVNDSYEADPMEVKIAKVVQNNEPIDSNAPIIYTNRADGVQAGYDIRTDRFDVAIDAMDKVSKTRLAQRAEYMKAEKGGKEPQSGSQSSDTNLKIV